MHFFVDVHTLKHYDFAPVRIPHTNVQLLHQCASHTIGEDRMKTQTSIPSFGLFSILDPVRLSAYNKRTSYSTLGSHFLCSKHLD